MTTAEARPARRPTAVPRTRDRARDIIDGAICLFNRNGVQATSTQKISSELKISSGNLHYHFKTTADLLAAIHEQMEAEINAALTAPLPTSPEEAVTWQRDLFTCLWRYRFMFSALDYLFQRAPALLERFQAFQTHAMRRILSVHQACAKVGIMKPEPTPKLAERFAENVWMIWTAWVRWETIQTQSGGGDTDNDEAVIRRLLDHSFSMAAPYLSARAQDRITAIINAEA